MARAILTVRNLNGGMIKGRGLLPHPVVRKGQTVSCGAGA